MHKAAYQLILSEGAQADLRECKAKDAYAAAVISQYLRELDNDIGACALLVDEHYSDDDIGSVEPLWSLQKEKMNAYRVRFILLGRWRVITAGDHRRRRVGILAIMERDANYQSDKELWKRIEKEYDELDFPRLGV